MQRNETTRGQLFSRRTFLLGAMKACLVSTLIGRLYYLQIIKSDEFQTLSDSNRIKHLVIPPLRGIIYDRNNVTLALNRNYYRVLLDPEQAGNKEQTLHKLTALLQTDSYKERYLLRKVKAQNHRRPIMLYDYLTWEEVSVVEVHMPDLPGVFVDVGQVRYYPYSVIMSHVIGYVSNVSETETDKNDPLLSHPDFKIGKSGLERLCEESLRGKPGIKRMEVNAFGLPVRELSLEESQPGKEVRLTLNIDLQSYIYKRLENISASCVVMEVNSGEILSICSTPGFDTNQFVEGIQPEYWSSLVHNNFDPLVHKAIARTYPPGSTFKVIVALAALYNHIITDNTTFTCPGYFLLGNRHFHCWRKEGHGAVNLHQALKGSCNVFFYNVAKKLGIDKIHEMGSWFGLGEKLSILPGEHPGLMPSRAWKKAKLKSDWFPGDTLNTGVGQGYLQVTTLQLATMMARLASGGRVITPNLILDNEPRKEKPLLAIPPEYLRSVLEGLRAVVNEPGGTAFRNRITEANYEMGGKTGTAQVMALKKNEEEFVPWHERHHGLFIGYAPLYKPRFAISVVAEHEGGGSRSAAPIAHDVLLYAQTHL